MTTETAKKTTKTTQNATCTSHLAFSFFLKRRLRRKGTSHLPKTSEISGPLYLCLKKKIINFTNRRFPIVHYSFVWVWVKRPSTGHLITVRHTDSETKNPPCGVCGAAST